MNGFWSLVFVVMVCGFGSGGVSAADGPTPVAPALPAANSVTVSRILLKPAEARITYEIRIEDPSQPVVLEVDNANPIADVVASISPASNNFAYGMVPTAGAVDAPHTIALTIPKAANYEFSLTDKSWIRINPQYVVRATEDNARLMTKVHVNLMATVRGKFNYKLSRDTTVVFKVGSFDREIDVQELPFRVGGSTVHPDLDGTPVVTHNLAYRANESSFGTDNTAKAVLQIPMLGNWPPKLTSPGQIQFEYLGVQNALIVPESGFGAAIVLPAQVFEDNLKITRYIGPVLGSDRFSSWPQLRYIDKHTYTTERGALAYVITSSKIPTSVPGNYDKPATLPLAAMAGQENSVYLSQLHAELGKLASQDATLTKLQAMLKQTIPVLQQQEARIKVLESKHMALVQSGASEDVLKISRAKLDSAKRAAAALVESYNAMVLSYPD